MNRNDAFAERMTREKATRRLEKDVSKTATTATMAAAMA
jgi:hypothetical protein